MKAKYILRLDDACETMNRVKWDRIFNIVDKYDIKPLIAVIPQVKDISLKFSNNYDRDSFFLEVKIWEQKGYTICCHGYEHIFHETDRKTYVPNKKLSEFVGLSLEEQKEKMFKAIQIFRAYNISPKCFIAPNHSFDKNTLIALKECTNIRIVSDCFAFDVFYEEGIYFIPQQLWSFKKMPFGLWTICLHPNTMSGHEFKELENTLENFSKYFVNFDQIELKKRKWSYFEKFINYNIWYRGLNNYSKIKSLLNIR